MISVGQNAKITDALARLRKGNARFVSGALRHPHLSRRRRQTTCREGQKPYAAVLSCSDSRVPVEHLFDAGIGDLFLVRIPGNVCRTDVIGAMEYAVEHLEVPVCVVLGHSQCGAVSGYLSGGHRSGPLGRLLAGIGPAVRQLRRTTWEVAQRDFADAVARTNVGVSVRALAGGSAVVRGRMDAGRLALIGGFYDLGTGLIEWL